MTRSPAVAVPSGRADLVLRRLLAMDVVDRGLRTTARGGFAFIPVRGPPAFDLSPFDARLEEANFGPRPPRMDPANAVRTRLRRKGVPEAAIPSGWERIGDVVVLQLPDAARGFEEVIGEAYAEVLGARTVVEDRSGVHGPLRTPDVRVLWGDNTDTVHVEGGVRFRLDVARVMFSSGNLAERLGGIAGRVRADEVVVDLFAGIGYFALPIALRSPAARVHACEVNPVAYEYLVENVRINRAANVVPHLGNCRAVAPRGVADWVVLGHFDAPQFLDVAFECLKGGGTLVVHSVHPKEAVPDAPIACVRSSAAMHGFEVLDARTRIVKSYAPRIVHVATEADVASRPKGLSRPNVSGERMMP